MPFPYVIKIGRTFNGMTFHRKCESCSQQLTILASKKLTKLAWRLTIDRYVDSLVSYSSPGELPHSQRTLVALQYPPHVVAIACLYLAALLSTFEQGETQVPPGCCSNREIVTILGDHGPWEKTFQAQVDDLEGEVS